MLLSLDHFYTKGGESHTRKFKNKKLNLYITDLPLFFFITERMLSDLVIGGDLDTDMTATIDRLVNKDFSQVSVCVQVEGSVPTVTVCRPRQISG